MSRAIFPPTIGPPRLSLDDSDPKAPPALAIDPVVHLASALEAVGVRKRARSASFRESGDLSQTEKLTTSAVFEALKKEAKKP
jgi:hypothetical protein